MIRQSIWKAKIKTIKVVFDDETFLRFDDKDYEIDEKTYALTILNASSDILHSFIPKYKSVFFEYL